MVKEVRYWRVLFVILPLLAAMFGAGGPSEMTPVALAAACAGGPTIDGINLNECIDRSFTIGANTRNVRVWYTNVQTMATRVDGGTTLTLSHWVADDNQPVQVAQAVETAWRRYFTDSGGHEPYINGCSRLNIQLEDGVGWAGIAYWGSSGNCNIGIDAPMIENGVDAGDRAVIAHEVQHYLQYSYDDGCYGYLRPNYPGDSEFVEGYADLGMDSVSAEIDALGYSGNGYDASVSMYNGSYGNRFNKYFIEQLGTVGVPSDPHHKIDAMYRHYEACNAADHLNVLDTLIPSLSAGARNEQRLFTDFFAANWAFPWANATTQPELTYFDNDGSWTSPALRQDASMASGSQSWPDTTPDLWAARYYQVRPQAGCPYVELAVDGAPGANLGINLMAAKTSAPTSVLRSSAIGADFVRTFAGAGVHNRLVVAINSFNTNSSYTVTATCVTPVVEILEPRQTNFALVGSPASPIAFPTRFRVLNGATAVRGLLPSSFTFEAEGAPITLSASAGAFQEVGGEYWAVAVPPVKPAGTTFVDYRVCLDGTICDTETDALLYVAPGNTDTALVFDASGSMNTEDTVGEGTRLTNAKKAGKVIANLLRSGDRIRVTDFSAFNTPAGCGLPGGDGNCPLDIRVRLGRTDVVGPATVSATNAAIDTISAREWTPVSPAIVEAKNAMLAAPFSLNPKHIHLLSDGQENVNPLWPAVSAEIIASGVVVNTIGFGPEAPGALLSQIATATGGRYRPVATSGSGVGLTAAAPGSLPAPGVDPQLSEVMAAPVLPGQLGLADVYDDFDTTAQGAARVFHTAYQGVPVGEYRTWQAQVDRSAQELRLVVAGKQDDIGGCNGWQRYVEVLPPGVDPKQRWFPISPRNSVTPAVWDIRNERNTDVLIVTNPAEGLWQFRTRYSYCIGLAGAPEQSLTADFIMNASVQSTIGLQGRFLNLAANQGNAGDTVPIVALLLDRAGTISGATVVARVESPGASTLHLLRDDGASNDGAAGDGIYGVNFGQTSAGGSYAVRIVAQFKDPANPAVNLSREWNGGFWINGPRANDRDKDGLPDDWEKRCDLDTNRNDAREDPDNDGLTNSQELQRGTLPCRPDTDNGGEQDGSEVRSQRDPLNAKDDKVCAVGVVQIRILNGSIRLHWPKRPCFTAVKLYLSERPGELGKETDIGGRNEVSLGQLVNGRPYYITLVPTFVDPNVDATGRPSEQYTATPKADPDPPSGAILIDNDAESTAGRSVNLNISSSDTPLEGAAQGANGHMTDQLSKEVNAVSGNVEMRISNTPTMADAKWEPLTQTRAWTLAARCTSGELCQVYAQFRDGELNESNIVQDSILLEASQGVYLPLIRR